MKKILDNKIYLKSWQSIVFLIFFAAVETVAAFIIAPGNMAELWGQIAGQPLIFVMNFLPAFLFMLLLFCIFNNIFISGAISFALITLLTYADYLKVTLRNDPLTPQDVLLWREAAYAVKDFDIALNMQLILFIAAGTLILLTLGVFIKSKPVSLRRRILSIIIVLILCTVIGETLYNADRYSARYIYYHRLERTDEANHAQNYEEMGFIYSFIYSFNAYGFTEPEGYSQSEAEAWEKSSDPDTDAIPALGSSVAEGASARPNIIMVMCEAFCDITNEEAFLYDQENDPLKNYNRLSASKNAISAHIVVPNVNAGTANTEFDVMTGAQTRQLADGSIPFFSLRSEKNSIAQVLLSEGYNTVFTHPGRAWYYNRQNVYDYLGFEELYFSDAYGEEGDSGSLVKDASVGDFIIKEFENNLKKGDEPLFTFAVTIENHMPYTVDRYGRSADKPLEELPLSVEVSEETEKTLAVYIEGVRSGDELLGQLTTYFESSDEPVILIFFGDHLPSLGEDFKAYKELGLAVGETNNLDTMLNSYETPYIIWSNESAEELCQFSGRAQLQGLSTGSFDEDNNTISANYLGALTLTLAGFDGKDPYFDFLNAARRELPIIWGEVAKIADGNGGSIEMINKLGDREKQLVRKEACWGYYRANK